MSNDENFKYSYSSSQRKEIELIRRKYVESKNESNLDELRRLDRAITNKASFVGVGVGLIGSFLMGIGLALVLNYDNYIIGVSIGSLGIVGMIIALPVNKKILKYQRKKNSQKVIELTDKLLKINKSETF